MATVTPKYDLNALKKQYGSNYMAGINTAKAAGNTGLADALTGLREQKIAASPALQNLYGAPTTPDASRTYGRNGWGGGAQVTQQPTGAAVAGTSFVQPTQPAVQPVPTGAAVAGTSFAQPVQPVQPAPQPPVGSQPVPVQQPIPTGAAVAGTSFVQPTQTTQPAEPTWQQKLQGFATDKQGAVNEILRAKDMYTQYMNEGNPTAAQAAAKWAGQVRQAAGLSDAEYGSGVNQTQVKQNFSTSQQPAQTTGTPTTGTGMTTDASQAVKPPTTTVGSTKDPNQVMFLRDYGLENGLQIGWDENYKTVTINGSKIDTTGLKLVDGKFQGTRAQLDTLLSNFLTPAGGTGTGLNPDLSQFNTQIAGIDTSLNQAKADYNTTYEAGKAENEAMFDQLAGFQPYQTPDELRQILSGMMGEFNKDFAYDPNTDPGLTQAQKQVAQATREEAASRGALYGDTAQSMVAQEMGKLIPQFQEAAYQKFQDKFQRKVQIANMALEMDSENYKRNTDSFQRMTDLFNITRDMNKDELAHFQDVRDTLFKEKEVAMTAKRDEFNMGLEKLQAALQKFDTTGYIDNDTTSILGLPVGTRTQAAKQAIIDNINTTVTNGAILAREIEDSRIAHEREQEIIKMNAAIEESRASKADERAATREKSADERRAAENVKDRAATAAENNKTRAANAAENEKDRAAKAKSDAANLALETKKLNAEITLQNKELASRAVSDKEKNKPSVNDMIADKYDDLKEMPVKDVIYNLTKNKSKYLGVYGTAGYGKLWNTVLYEAITIGQAKAYKATPADKKVAQEEEED